MQREFLGRAHVVVADQFLAPTAKAPENAARFISPPGPEESAVALAVDLALSAQGRPAKVF